MTLNPGFWSVFSEEVALGSKVQSYFPVAALSANSFDLGEVA